MKECLLPASDAGIHFIRLDIWPDKLVACLQLRQWYITLLRCQETFFLPFGDLVKFYLRSQEKKILAYWYVSERVKQCPQFHLVESRDFSVPYLKHAIFFLFYGLFKYNISSDCACFVKPSSQNPAGKTLIIHFNWSSISWYL